MSACPGRAIQCCSAHICPCVASSACHHTLFKHVLKTWLFVLKSITMAPEFINSIIHLCGIFKTSMHYCPFFFSFFFFFGLQNEAQLSGVLILSQIGSFRVLGIKQHSILSGQTLIDFSCSCKRSLFLHRSPQYLKLCNQNCRALKSISHHLGKVPFKRLAWHHIGILWQREEQCPGSKEKAPFQHLFPPDAFPVFCMKTHCAFLPFLRISHNSTLPVFVQGCQPLP